LRTRSRREASGKRKKRTEPTKGPLLSQKFFQSLENARKIFPIIGKTGQNFPTISIRVWPLFCIHSPPADRPGDRSGCLAFLHGGALGRPPFLLTQANRLPPRCNRRPEGRLDHCRGLDLMPLWGAREAS
jgi:hypothetical protein